MKKINSFLFSFFLLAFQLSAQTPISGVIQKDSVLDLAHSPYLVTDNVVVLQGVTLTMKPGVTLLFNKGLKLGIRGKLLAIGNKSDSIVFSSALQQPAAGDWSGIDIQNTLGGSAFLSYIKVLYSELGAGLTCCGNVDYKITHSRFSFNSAALTGYSGSLIAIDSCEFSFNNVASTGADKIFSNSNFNHNQIGISEERTRAINCTFTHHSKYALATTDFVCGSLFENNNVGIAGYYSAFYTNCKFVNNDTAVVINSVSSILPTGNSFENNKKFNVVLYTSQDYDLSQNNCWGTTNSDSIAKKIYDVFDNVNLGRVRFNGKIQDCQTKLYSCTNNIDSMLTATLDIQEAGGSFFPNPTSGKITFQTGTVPVEEVKIFNSLGVSIYESKEVVGNAAIDIDLSRNPKGIYLVQLLAQGMVYRQTIVVE